MKSRGVYTRKKATLRAYTCKQATFARVIQHDIQQQLLSSHRINIAFNTHTDSINVINE